MAKALDGISRQQFPNLPERAVWVAAAVQAVKAGDEKQFNRLFQKAMLGGIFG